MQGRDVMTMFIECIYEFFNNPSNLAEFEEWKKSKVRSDCNERTIEFQKRCGTMGPQN